VQIREAVVARVRAHDVGIVGERRDARHRNRGEARVTRSASFDESNLCARHRDGEVERSDVGELAGCIHRLNTRIWIWLTRNTV
jgi:hypothetical protein